jgi:hypothetical protein
VTLFGQIEAKKVDDKHHRNAFSYGNSAKQVSR